MKDQNKIMRRPIINWLIVMLVIVLFACLALFVSQKALASGKELSSVTKPITKVNDLKENIDYFEETGELTNENVIHELKIHLTAVEHFENNNKLTKVIKHLDGFNELLKHQIENGQISEKVYRQLKSNTAKLIKETKIKNEEPKLMVYYRAWRDVTMQGVNTDLPDENQMSMDDIPYGVDIVNVFSFVPEGEEDQAAPFFEELKDTYVPNLHERGMKVTTAIDYRDLVDGIEYVGETPTEEEYDKYAQEILEEKVYAYNLDGLDIDMEFYPTTEEVEISDGIIKALSKYIGPKGEEGTLLVYDTNGSNLDPFENVADSFTYLGYQQYGSDSERTESAIADYEDVFPKGRFMPGLAFPEEQDYNNRWYDAEEPYEKSNIKNIAEYVYENDLYGMFLYALDRDGRTYEEEDLNHVKPTNLLWTKTAILEVKGYSLDESKELAVHHWNRVQELDGEKDETIQKIHDATSIYEVNKVLLGSSDNFEKDAASLEYDPLYEEILIENEQ